MAKYCRYCSFAYLVKRFSVFCEKKSEFLTIKQAKHTNNCREHELNPIDVLRTNVKGYQPTGIKPVEHGGVGKQVRMDEILKAQDESRIHSDADTADNPEEQQVSGRTDTNDEQSPVG